MHFKQINKTTWRCIADGPRHPVTGKRQQIARRGKSKGEAKKKVEEAIAELNKAYNYDTKITFQDFSAAWMKHYRMRGNKETTCEYREYCIGLLNNYLAKRKIVDVTTVEIQGALSHLFEKGTANSTLKGVHNVANMIFKYAKEVGLIESSPVNAVFVPKKQLKIEQVNGNDTAQLFLESHELKEFLQHTDSYRNVIYRTLIYLITFTGMRPGEALALKLEDVDLENKVIRVTKTVYAKKSIKGDFGLTPPKTYGSVRSIDIDDIVVEKLQHLYAIRQKRDWTVSGYVFGDKNGVPPTVKLLNQTVGRIGEKTDVQKRFYTYILRHTHISLLAEAGVDLHFIMNRVGHKNSNTTTKIYLHVTSGMRKSASDKMHAKFTELLTD